MSGRLEGRVALVTGAARRRGIGFGIARALADEGADVAIVDVAEDEADAIVDDLRGTGRRVAFHRVDVGDREQVDAVVQRVRDDFGALDIVCSNAGVAVWATIAETDDAAFDRVVRVNLTGAFNVGQAAARAMVEQGRGGRIVFTSSVHVQMGFGAMSVYGATKQGVRALAETMAIELGRYGIRVNHIGPGWVLSELNDSSPATQSEDVLRENLARVPIESRAADPYEMGRAVVYLASSDGDYVTGEYLRVDGGLVVGKF